MKEDMMSDVNGRIGEIVNGHDIVLFMKGTALFPQCGFSSRAVAILEGEFVGGSDIMMEMFEAGELQQLLADKRIVSA
jgi:monothiol glutaredoxin